MHKHLFVFDIETVPDLKAARRLLGNEVPESKLSEALTQYHLDITGGKNDFIRQLFHQVVAISFLEAEIHTDGNGGEHYVLTDIRSGGAVDSTEEELVRGAFQYLSSLKPRLVSFNGRTFDMPVLKYRAMHHGVQARWLYHAGDKWNCYSSRYSHDWHCDLLDVLSDYGISSRVKISEVCALFGLPGKIDVDGSKVHQLYNASKLEEIRDYCELDVINTYLIYLKYMHHTGKLTSSNYKTCIDDLTSFLEEKAPQKQNFALFLYEWRNCRL